MRGRMRKEIAMLESDPPFGVSAWPKDDQLDRLEAQIMGPEGSPYERGLFNLEIDIPERYPFEPPKVRFLTPIYHPNIDDGGRICLDTLKMQPKGSWLPSVNICTLLTTIRLLMAEPNADDGLMPDIADIFKHNRELFNSNASEMTLQHACNLQASTEKDDLKENEKNEATIPDTQVAKDLFQTKDLNSSDDAFSDGFSSSEDEESDSFQDEIETNPQSKRVRRE
ncbi:ubiquitin-conjugating enzyme e2 t-like [Plasmopara halstedii]|uniref:E2 ubiquitin-conjugating enzyme n=1 Tax=Plasmopara halstedii TaxID=4781 RepID=A0A0P1ABW9_PLAHL|nr:ubiquitin-conjugating enzyme e2 t-like [Plasmopara halstedii]CEG37964.1 ubiquitin-conjugating enzyme e2 t-like [Plasmopara halstedii]|eukprot:XP_024574333.1 ubiquitin-conjugating enzyme e2 t-like [Plasmopara halstedii]